MRGSLTSLVRPLMGVAGGVSTISEKIVSSVLFERLPVAIPNLDPVVYAFQEFSFRWRQQYRRKGASLYARGKGYYQIDYVPAPRITEADKTNDRKSLQRAVDRRLYLLLYGNSNGAPSENLCGIFQRKFMILRRHCSRKCSNGPYGYKTDGEHA
ncbi:Detected protein of confused Function [Hibiscus syriacus]|uniref:Detected protein of confused Function n=1 Tax=Hibiscus syriacus TaxID=106335 RepID=A0A6A3BHU6_HIBSY|nr:Detected protein of confused Function [Hibiscus syriacus]